MTPKVRGFSHNSQRYAARLRKRRKASELDSFSSIQPDEKEVLEKLFTAFLMLGYDEIILSQETAGGGEERDEIIIEFEII